MQLKINHIQHTGIPVMNLRVSEAFYERLGFINVMHTPFDHQGITGLVTMMKLKETVIELYQLTGIPHGEAIRTRGDGHIDHIAFDVDDIDATFSFLKNNGFTIIEPEPVFLPFWKKGCRFFNITGPDGERLEFNQILK